MDHITEAVHLFFEFNKQIPKDEQLPVTCGVIAAHALVTKDQLLSKHNNQTDKFLLLDEEVASLEAFTAFKS